MSDMTLRYQAILPCVATTNDPRTGTALSMDFNYETHNKLRDRRVDAISDGFDQWGHDDFRIAVWDGDKLISFDWMYEPLERDEGELLRVERQLRGEL